MWKWLQNYFVFTRGEKRVIVLLLSIIVLAVVVPRLYTLTQPAKQIDNSEYKEEAARFAQQLKEAEGAPNTYRLSQSADTTSFQRTANYKPAPSSLSIEINSADSSALEKLPGIGAVLAKRIVSFRNLLGGYSSVEQLQEVYGLKPETFELIKPNLKVNTALIERININTADEKQLRRHPYFKAFAKQLINARPFNNLDDVKNKAGIDAPAFNKMKPYIQIK
jgi:competence protein ComEA